MKYPIVSDVETGCDGDGASLSDLLDSLAEDRGRVASTRVLGVNYRTLVNCCDSRRVSWRMRQALADFRKAGGLDDSGTDVGNHDDDGVSNDGDNYVLR